MDLTRVLALVLAGGNGTRLHPLTSEHAKPALPFAGGYRLIDFVLGNLINSRISPIYVLVQYRPQSLIEHIRTAWAPYSFGINPWIRIVGPRSDIANASFNGTADAVYQNLDLIARHQAELVAVFASDQVYRMDVRQMVEFHRRCNAEASIAAVRVPLEVASSFGNIVVGQDGRIEDFQEKPEQPVPIPLDPGSAYASMGNYLFNPSVLAELLEEASARGETDFGRHVLPRLVYSRRAFAYDFAGNAVPGVQSWEERGYWRDVGTLDAYRAALRDVRGPLLRFSLTNPQWPIRGGYQARFAGAGVPAYQVDWTADRVPMRFRHSLQAQVEE